MSERTAHPETGAYALDLLDPAERRAVERHLESCPDCRAELDAMRATAALIPQAGTDFDVPPDLERRTLAAVRRARDAGDRRRTRRVALAALAAAAALVAGAVLVTRAVDDAGPRGVLELRASLTPPSSSAGPGAASATVRRTDLGREIELRSDTLPILPKGEFYEVWFIGPGDAPGTRNRISAGTFHPDPAGRSRLVLHAAVDPALFPTISITAERGDGNPDPGREVLRSPA